MSSRDEDVDAGLEGQDAPLEEYCLAKGVGTAITGGIMGGVFGTGVGLVQRKGFMGALKEGGTSARTFAIMSAVHSTVACYMKKLRGREDPINAGIAGCATGLALGWGSSPQMLLQGCLGFGAFSYIFDFMNPPAAAVAATQRGCGVGVRRRQAGARRRRAPISLTCGGGDWPSNVDCFLRGISDGPVAVQRHVQGAIQKVASLPQVRAAFPMVLERIENRERK